MLPWVKVNLNRPYCERFSAEYEVVLCTSTISHCLAGLQDYVSQTICSSRRCLNTAVPSGLDLELLGTGLSQWSFLDCRLLTEQQKSCACVCRHGWPSGSGTGAHTLPTVPSVAAQQAPTVRTRHTASTATSQCKMQPKNDGTSHRCRCLRGRRDRGRRGRSSLWAIT